ncbi:hypothetical protein AWJ20_1375 [Sugiyamaella lignohabitans]|uniref:Major facilitator superfamily (MFS) profile domain-containing protein n=1 Tax=Sugiyamaella lignohabitans TaxID=796027 RepID=A0A167DN84_9ASCO|nr:uncharacterized protein AWJ20_1375 [Sugiyamaella lignohabitans]ANB13096.1 hypothetical protein AWJ20_1375 [Sugiyamaella lignohabitans]
MAPAHSSGATPRLFITAGIAAIGAMQFGFHLAELNSPQDIVTCGPAGIDRPIDPSYDCIPMSSADIGMVNGIYSIGGFLSASVAGSFADGLGRRKVVFANCVLFVLGSSIIANSHSVLTMCTGRFIAGLGAGSAIVVTPLYLNEISPVSIRGALGTINQISVNIGILLAQVLGLFLSTEDMWRRILFSGSIIAIANAALLPLCVESPKWLALKGMTPEALRSLRVLRGEDADIDGEVSNWKSHDNHAGGSSLGLTGDEESSLLAPSSENRSPNQPFPAAAKKVGVLEFCTATRFRKIFIAVVGVMVSQQICGVNSIIFYGVSVLATTLPRYSGLVNVLISLLNLAVTTAISPFVDTFGRRPLLLASILGMTFSSAVLARAMIGEMPVVASTAATAFVVSFAVGLGPIPFLIISEMTPNDVVGMAQSIGTTANWMASFLVGFLFPILKAQLGSYVFYIFTLTGAVAFTFVFKFVPETKGKSLAAVWAQ